jgi:hypothetical protein
VHRTAALRRQVAGVAPVGGGLFVLGISAYVVLGAAGHALTPRDYAAVASLYLLVAITSPGVFTALEQETNREVSSRRAVGLGTVPVGRAGLLVGAGFAGLVAVALVALAPLLVPRVLAGSWGLLAAAVVAAGGAAAVYLLRGLFAGERRFGWYATSLALEGTARLVPCVLLALIGATNPLAYGWAFALGTGIAALLCLPGRRAGSAPRTPTNGTIGGTCPTNGPLVGNGPDGGGQPRSDRLNAGPPVEVRAMARATGLLIVASGLTYVVANTAPLVLTARLPAAPEVAASYVSLFVLARRCWPSCCRHSPPAPSGPTSPTCAPGYASRSSPSPPSGSPARCSPPPSARGRPARSSTPRSTSRTPPPACSARGPSPCSPRRCCSPHSWRCGCTGRPRWRGSREPPCSRPYSSPPSTRRRPRSPRRSPGRRWCAS